MAGLTLSRVYTARTRVGGSGRKQPENPGGEQTEGGDGVKRKKRKKQTKPTPPGGPFPIQTSRTEGGTDEEEKN